MSRTAPVFISPEALQGLTGAPDVVIVDLSDEATHDREHIPGAVFLDAGAIARARPPVMGLLPPADALGAVLGEAGIGPEDHVIVYDAATGLRAARFAWTLDAIGHERVSVLDGGLDAWLDAGLPTTDEEAAPRHRPPYPVAYRADRIADRDHIMARLGDADTCILDTRTAAEFAGSDRRAARGGHIPGAVHIEWSTMVRGGGDLRLRPREELEALLAAEGVTPDRDVIVHCQTHQRSAHTFLVLKALGFPRLRGYPGSWSEWGNDPDTPVEV